ncbi:hypothetical protein L1987_30295 [Smallanthus sonchifolius]|uniref:Uncharacterized protein n=1 Tax=Smallanthus sonchifolius TaxID=185202 RepID=A0ACB9I3U7_9ASTR|nr:hypothetical protein L1987_30295 [Smallanthus sonchifolius]
MGAKKRKPERDRSRIWSEVVASTSCGDPGFTILPFTVHKRLCFKERVNISTSEVEEEDHQGVDGWKKFRLTKAPSTLLDEAFKHHSTLNPVCTHTSINKSKSLQRELRLRPRQVEVWFEIRRASSAPSTPEEGRGKVADPLKQHCVGLKGLAKSSIATEHIPPLLEENGKIEVLRINCSAKTPVAKEDIGKFYTYHSYEKKEDYYLCYWIRKYSIKIT